MLSNPSPSLGPLTGHESDTVVLDAQLDTASRGHQADANRVRVGVPDGVGQSFLRHAEQAEGDVGVERVETVSRIEGRR